MKKIIKCQVPYMKVYNTSEAAKIIGIHPNTVRRYEEWGFITKPERRQNGYRIFTELHLEQIRLARAALKVEIVQNGLRKTAVSIIKTCAAGNLEEAKNITKSYMRQIENEQRHAEEAIKIVTELLSRKERKIEEIYLTRKQAADYLGITIDTLRNWELNGLLTVRRKQNGYRVYTAEDIRQLEIIRALRCANYSLSAILRMLNAFARDPQINIEKTIDTPNTNDEIVSVCDKLLTSLQYAGKNAAYILQSLEKMKLMNPTL